MDVAYARGWSLGLDLRLLCRTPFAVSAERERRDLVHSPPNRRCRRTHPDPSFDDLPVRVAVVGLGYWGPEPRAEPA